MTPRRTTDQAAETRALLVRAGRELFGGIGFAAAKASDIAERAGVTRGALLHHFGDKEGLFAAVLEEVEAESATRVLEVAITGSDPLEWLRRGFEAFLVECVKPEITQIMLIDGPSVLGWETWHEIDAQYGYRPLLDVVEAAVTAGLMESDDPSSVAYLLLGALTEAGTVIAHAEDPEVTRVQMAKALNRLVDGLRPAAAEVSGGDDAATSQR
jgi:AcrR family transcriptional regulator